MLRNGKIYSARMDYKKRGINDIRKKKLKIFAQFKKKQ